VYPYELIARLVGEGGTFVEHDLDEHGGLVAVQRPYGLNTAGLVVAVVTTPTARYPEGMTRVALFGDPTKALGTVAEAECSRLVAAIDLAERMRVPVEWFALSSGATISMESGTENMDWVARGLRRIITFTQAGGEINVVVAGINVGAQPYWNAEATMLMHTRGVLVMTPDSAMVLTGKQSLDYSGGVSAEDNFGIGGYDRVMGPNGQAQYWAPDLTAACEILFAHYDHAYVAPGERFPRRASTSDPLDRDISSYPHVCPGSDFTVVGDIFSAEKNPERKKPFDIRTVMRAVVDHDHDVLERWADMADAETSVVYDAHLGGYPATLVGIESRAVPRKGWAPADGPDQWTAGTLFPQSSTKTARAINAASGNRPVTPSFPPRSCGPRSSPRASGAWPRPPPTLRQPVITTRLLISERRCSMTGLDTKLDATRCGGGESLSGRVAFVTGGTRGIGAAICKSLGDQHATVAAGFGQNTERAEAFADDYEKLLGMRPSLHHGNVACAEDCRRTIREVIGQHGRLDILVNNAGMAIDRTVAKMTDEDWYTVLAVNLSGAFFMSQAALAHMVERGSGRIINVSSVIGETGNIGQANYSASKSGLFGLTKTLAKEAAFQCARAGKSVAEGIGLSVNTITPGFIGTEMVAAMPEKVIAKVTSQIPVGRFGRPEEIGRVVDFLAADASSYITGQVWGVNGGLDM
jgi:NAD(P)-dependent dehydrogenase (short-subunit alcohol dehydrogenase family)/acetyl-CoA carboxylase carboxyltransferase component